MQLFGLSIPQLVPQHPLLPPINLRHNPPQVRNGTAIATFAFRPTFRRRKLPLRPIAEMTPELSSFVLLAQSKNVQDTPSWVVTKVALGSCRMDGAKSRMCHFEYALAMNSGDVSIKLLLRSACATEASWGCQVATIQPSKWEDWRLREAGRKCIRNLISHGLSGL